MGKESKKDLLIILILTIVFGIGAYLLAGQVDKTVSDVTAIRHEIDELTRIASDKEGKIEEINAVANYDKMLNENLPEISEIISILEQLENIAKLTGTEVSISLEEGVIGEGEIEFKEEKEKIEFLKKLEVKEYTPENKSQDSDNNVVLQMMQESGEEGEELKISYLEIDLSITGVYDGIRSYISLLETSNYFYNIREIRLSKSEEGYIEGSLKIRAFIFEKDTN